ncbi:unnamed protein product [Spodoptera exigua]|nr:unnamed protein product [Spodoptera exigua]
MFDECGLGVVAISITAAAAADTRTITSELALVCAGAGAISLDVGHLPKSIAVKVGKDDLWQRASRGQGPPLRGCPGSTIDDLTLWICRTIRRVSRTHITCWNPFKYMPHVTNLRFMSLTVSNTAIITATEDNRSLQDGCKCQPQAGRVLGWTPARAAANEAQVSPTAHLYDDLII